MRSTTYLLENASLLNLITTVQHIGKRKDFLPDIVDYWPLMAICSQLTLRCGQGHQAFQKSKGSVLRNNTKEGTLAAMKAYIIAKEGRVPEELGGLFAPEPQPSGEEREPTSPVNVTGVSCETNGDLLANT